VSQHSAATIVLSFSGDHLPAASTGPRWLHHRQPCRLRSSGARKLRTQQRQTLLKDQTLELAASALMHVTLTESHLIRVAELAGRLGEYLELGDREVELIHGGCSCLGKIGCATDSSTAWSAYRGGMGDHAPTPTLVPT